MAVMQGKLEVTKRAKEWLKKPEGVQPSQENQKESSWAKRGS